jgi:hypothetical protein
MTWLHAFGYIDSTSQIKNTADQFHEYPINYLAFEIRICVFAEYRFTDNLPNFSEL